MFYLSIWIINMYKITCFSNSIKFCATICGIISTCSICCRCSSTWCAPAEECISGSSWLSRTESQCFAISFCLWARSTRPIISIIWNSVTWLSGNRDRGLGSRCFVVVAVVYRALDGDGLGRRAARHRERVGLEAHGLVRGAREGLAVRPAWAIGRERALPAGTICINTFAFAYDCKANWCIRSGCGNIHHRSSVVCWNSWTVISWHASPLQSRTDRVLFACHRGVTDSRRY